MLLFNALNNLSIHVHYIIFCISCTTQLFGSHFDFVVKFKKISLVAFVEIMVRNPIYMFPLMKYSAFSCMEWSV